MPSGRDWGIINIICLLKKGGSPMAEYILNLLPVTEEEKAAFQAAAPRAVHVCAGGAL